MMYITLIIKIPSNSTVGKLTLACSGDTFSIIFSNASCDAMKGKHRYTIRVRVREINYNAHLVFTSPHFISWLAINIGLLRSSNNNYIYVDIIYKRCSALIHNHIVIVRGIITHT